MTNIEILNDDFKLDEYGYALIVKLVERRILEDIWIAEREVEEQNIKIKNNTSDNWLMRQKRSLDTNSAKKLETEIQQKKDWLSQWLEQMWPQRESTEINFLKQSSLEDTLAIFRKR